MIVAIIAVIVLIPLSIIIFYKVLESVKRKTATLEFTGQTAIALDTIYPGKDGFVLFHGEHWKATSQAVINPNQKVKIISREGLTLNIAPLSEITQSRNSTLSQLELH